MGVAQNLQAYVALRHLAKNNKPLESRYIKFYVNRTDKRCNKFCYIVAYVGTIINMATLRDSEIGSGNMS